jgi:hypothetical protein
MMYQQNNERAGATKFAYDLKSFGVDEQKERKVFEGIEGWAPPPRR